LPGTALGQAEKLFQSMTGNSGADFKGTRRYENIPWFALVGVAFLLSMAFAIIAEVSLSFLGFGIQPPTSSLGNVFTNAPAFMRQGDYLISIPSAMLSSLMLMLLVIGVRPRDVLPF